MERLASRALLIDQGEAGPSQAIAAIRGAMGRRILEIELDDDLPEDTVGRLRGMGVSVHERSLRADASATCMYSVLDTLRPAPIASCNVGQASLRDVMENIMDRRAA